MKRKLLAILTTFCLVLTAFSQFVLPVLATETNVPAGAPEFTHTFSDFGINGTYSANKSSAFSGNISKLLDGGTISEIIKREKIGSGAFFYLFESAAGSWKGLQFKIPSTYASILVTATDAIHDSGSYPDSPNTGSNPYMEIRASEFGLTNFSDTEFDFSAHFEKGDVNGDGSIDLQIQFYINGQQCMFTPENGTWPAFQNGIYTIPGGYDKIVGADGSTNKYFSFYSSGSSSMTFRKPFKVTHTFRDFGFQDGNWGGDSSRHYGYNTSYGTEFLDDIKDLLDGGMLYEQFSSTSLSSSGYRIAMFSPTSNREAGLQVFIYSNRITVQLSSSSYYRDVSLTNYVDIYASEAGLSSFVGKPFEFGMAFEKKDTDGNGSNDLLIRFYVNGRRMSKTASSWTGYQKGVFTIPGGYDRIVNKYADASAEITHRINLHPYNSNLTISGNFDTHRYLDYNAFSYLDFGVTGGIYNANSAGNAFLGDNIAKLLDGGYLKETVRLNSIGSNNFFTVLFADTASSWSGLQIQYVSGSNGYGDSRIQFNVSASLTDTGTSGYLEAYRPKNVGLNSFIGSEFELMLVFDKADVDKNGSNDLLVKIYINGHRLWTIKPDANWPAFQNGVLTIPGGYDKIVNAEGNTNKYLNIYPQSGNATFTDTCKDTLSEDNYTAYTLYDAAISDGYSWAYGSLKDSNSDVVTGNAYNGTVFGAKLTFTKEGARFHYAMPEKAKYAGLQIRLESTGNLKVASYSNQLTYKSIDIYASQFGYTTFLNRPFTLQITTDLVDVNNNGGKNDVKFGIWIDGVLANHCYVYALDQASILGSYIGINEGSGAVHYSLTDLDAPTGAIIQYVQLEDGKPYLVDADLFKDAKGSSYKNGDTVSVPGDYTAYYSADDYMSKSQKQVAIWKPFDTNSDGNINILDLISIKKHITDSETVTASKSRASDINNDGRKDSNDIVLLINNLLGAEYTVPDSNGVYYDTAADGKVMPIGSWVTPDIFNGVGINSENYGLLTYYIDYGVETNFLQDKYFDMIKDLGINVLTYQQADYGTYAQQRILKALSLAEKHNLYAYVKDYGIADDIADSSSLASRLNEYARYSSFLGIHVTDEPSTSTFNAGQNKTVTEIGPKTSLLNSFSGLEGFVNLFPVCRSGHASYFSEYISNCKPKQLSYDYYPFSGGNYSVKEYFNSLYYINKAANENDLPFVGFAGTSNYSYSTSPNDEINTITSAQISWNVNTLLAYGAKGINWFTLLEPYSFALKGSDGNITGMDFNRAGAIGANGNPTQVYNYVKNVNSWIGQIDGILMNCKNVAVLADGILNDTNRANWTNTYGDFTISASTSGGYDTGALAGVFDYAGKTVYYIVNNNYSTQQNISISLGSESNIAIYKRNSSVANESNVTSKTLTIPAGEAVLIVRD